MSQSNLGEPEQSPRPATSPSSYDCSIHRPWPVGGWSAPKRRVWPRSGPAGCRGNCVACGQCSGRAGGNRNSTVPGPGHGVLDGERPDPVYRGHVPFGSVGEASADGKSGSGVRPRSGSRTAQDAGWDWAQYGMRERQGGEHWESTSPAWSNPEALTLGSTPRHSMVEGAAAM